MHWSNIIIFICFLAFGHVLVHSIYPNKRVKFSLRSPMKERKTFPYGHSTLPRFSINVIPPASQKGKISWLRGQCCGFHFHFSQSVSVNSQVTYPNFPKFKNHGKTCSNQQNVNLTRSIIPWKKDNLSVYNIRKVYFASLLSFLKKQDGGPTRFEIARHLLV